MAEPTKLTAGDTWSWTRTGGDYPASEGWVLTYYLSLPGGTVKTLTTSSSGSDFTATVTAADSALYSPGLWVWTARVEKGGEAYTVETGRLRVMPNPATAAALQTHAEKCLIVIETALEKCLGDAFVEYEIDGVRFKKNRTELLSLRTFYREEVRQERTIQAGKSPIRTIKVALR